MMEVSGSGAGAGSGSLTNGSGCGSGRAKNIWIRIRNTGVKVSQNLAGCLIFFFLISQDPDGLNMTAREMSLVEGYVSASDFLLTSKIQDIPVWLIREIIRSGLMVSSP